MSLVSVGVPLYNAERYLAAAFDSLLAQDYADLELVVCDNASTDATWEICLGYAARDSRIRLHRNDVNRGAAYNYNRVVREAAGALFKWAAYDDLCAPSLVRECVAELDAAADAVLAYPQTMLIDSAGEVTGRFEDRLDLRQPRSAARVQALARRFNLCNAVFGVVRRDVLLRTGLIRPYQSSDVTLLAELAAYGRFHEVASPLFFRRIHPASTRQAGPRRSGEVAAWFDPRRRSAPLAPRLALALRTAGALWAAELPLPDRLGSAAGFVTRYGIRRGRAVAGRARRTLIPTGRRAATTAGSPR
ncbi:MAG: glycosyltransferase family 2 protein [Micromonosporaceae bacterium]